MLAEPEYLCRALSNLIRNAVRYAAYAGPIRVSTRQADGKIYVTVADNGPGAPEAALEDVDPSRNQQTGGAGLGLAIVKFCIEAYRGAVHCRNRKPSGLEVEIELREAGEPLAAQV